MPRLLYRRIVIPALLAGTFAMAGSAAADEKPVLDRLDALRKKAAALTKKADDAKKTTELESNAAVRRVRKVPAPKNMNAALRRLAAVRTSVDWKEMPIDEAIDYIGRLAGFNVIVGPALQNEGIEGVPKLTLKLTDVNLRTLSQLITRLTKTKLAMRNRILLFTTPEAARGVPVLRIYSIGDLTHEIRNFPGPDMNLRSSGAEFEEEEESIVESGLSDPEKIADMLREFVESETWEHEKVSMSADERRLVVRQYPEVHKKIVRFLNMLRGAR